MDVFGWELYRVDNDCTNDCLVSSCDISDHLIIGEWVALYHCAVLEEYCYMDKRHRIGTRNQ